MSDVKLHLSKGRPEWRPEFMELHVDDFRAFDIIAEHPSPELSAWGRPWVEIETLDGYPIEYRAFVIDGEIVGVSNYYPQRALTLTAERQIDINSVYELTRKLVTAQTLPINCPQAHELDLTRNQFTADFVRLANGSISFLEGGPPHTPRFGAHPCCFVAGEIEGVALVDRNPKRA